MHCIQDILQSNDNDDLLCKSTSTNASPFSCINSPNSTPSNQSLQIESNKHHQHITSNFFDAVKKWLNGKDKEKKEFGDIMRKIQNHSSFNEISVRARKLFGKRNDFYEQLMLLVSPSHNKSPVFINAVNDNVLLSNSVCLQLPTLNETMHTSNIDISDTDQNTFETAANRKQQNLKSDSMLNLVHQSPNKPNEKKRKRDELLTHNNFNSNGQTHNPSKKRKTSNHSIQGSSNIPTNNSYKYNKNKSNGNTNLDNHIWSTIDNNYTNTLLPSTSNISTSTNSSIANDNNHNRIPYKKHRKSKHKKNNTNKHNSNSNNKNNNKGKDMHSDDAVLNELMDGIEEDMGLPIHILATIKQELIKENPRNFQLFLQGMALCSIGIVKPDQFVNMMSPLFVGNKKLKLVLHQLRTILHVPLHYFHSTPLYAPFLSDLTTSDKNMNLSLRSNAEQYSHIVNFQNNCTKIRMNPTRSPSKNPQRRSLSPYKKNMTSSSSLSSKSMSISAKYNSIINNSNCISYRQNPHYKKNLICSNKQPFHLQIVNDEYVSRSTGAENNPENDHMTNRNKHEIELNEKEHILTLWDYYVEQNKHAIQCLRRLESRILYLYKQYKKIFIIRDDYDSSDNNDDKSSVVDESNIHFYDSDTYTTATEDLRGSDSDVSIDDNHSTNSEPLTHLISRTFPRKSVSTGGAVHSIPEHKSMMDMNMNMNNNDSDGTVMTTRSDMTHGRYHIKPKINKKINDRNNNNNNNNNIKKRIRKKRNIQKTETDKKYVLSRIYADIDMNEYMTPIAWSAVHRLYDEHFQNVKVALYNNPLSAINIVLPRLEMKHKEWENNRQMAQGIYRDVAQRNCMKALDWQPKYKRLDKTRLSHNELWRELIAAQSLLNPKYIRIIENERQKRSGLKETQREQFNKQYSPMDGASTIKPTKLIQQHFAAKVGSNCTREIERRLEGKRMMNLQLSEQDQKQDGDGDSEMDDEQEHKSMNHKFDFRMNIYYNYGLRFDLRDSNFDSVINLPLTSHEHCWNVVVQYLSTEYQHKKMKDVILEDVVKFYSNFIFLLFEIDLFHEELFPSKVFNKLSFEHDDDDDDDNMNDENDSIKFDDLCKMKMIGVNISELKYKPLVYDLEYFGEDIDMNGCDDNMISYHNRMSHIILVNRDIYNIMRLYIHLFQRLQKARDLSTNRWRLNFDPNKKEENEILQEKNEREFYGKLLALIQGQIKETEFDLIIQQLFGPEGYECSNIKYLIKSLCVSTQNILMNGKNKKRYVSGDGKVWDIIKLWHFYYPIWKQIDVNNVKQRIGMLRRYYSDIGNVLNSADNIVLIEYFLDSREIGVQFLGDNNQNKSDNDFVQSNMISRWWQMPVKHSNGWKYVQNMPFLRKKQEKLEKYRIKKQNKSNNHHNNNNKKSSSYKRINTMMDNMTMNIFEGYSKRQCKNKNKNKNNKNNRGKKKKKKKKNDDLFFIMRGGQPISMNYNNNHNEYTSDDSNISKSKRKRKRKSKTNGHLNNNNNNINMNGSNHISDISECGEDDNNNKNLSIWYHPNSRLYFQSINLSKISKRNKPLHKNRISVNKYDKKLKKFNLWHEKRFKEIQRSKQHINHNNNNNNSNSNSNNNSVRSNDKYNNTFSPQLNGGGNHSKNNNNNNNNIFTISNDHNNNNNNLLLNNSHNNSPYSTHNNNNNNNPLAVSSALNNLIPSSSSSNVNSLLSTTNQQQSIQQLINTNQSLSLNTNTNNNNINNLLINNISTPTNTSQQQTQLYTTTNSVNGQSVNNNNVNTSSGTIYAALNTNNNMLAATQQAAQQYYAYRTTTGNNNTQLITTGGSVNGQSANTPTNGQLTTSNNGQATQYAVATTTGYPSAYATYGQYTVGTTPTGYVAIQQQGVSPHTANASYVMDNRTGSIYAAIPATGHYTTSNGMGVYAVPTTSQTHPSQTQYVSIPTTQITPQGIQHPHHMQLTQSSVNNGQQSTAVVLTNTNNTNQSVNNTPQTNNSQNSQNNTMSTPPNIGVQDKINDNPNNSNNSMQLPVLNASSVRNSSNDTNNNNKSDVK